MPAVKIFENTNIFKSVLDSEYELLENYRNLLKHQTQARLEAWVFELARRRMSMVSSLVDEFGFRLSVNPGDKEPVEETEWQQKDDLRCHLLDAEARHAEYLNEKTREYYCPRECRILIDQRLLPMAEENMAFLNSL